MQATTYSERTLTELDFARLTVKDGQLPEELENSFDFPTLVASKDISADIVTMNSQVEIKDLQSGLRQTLTICYPRDAAPNSGLISVLSPVGSSLLGLRVGSIARWQTPYGGECTAEITALAFQPEANGDFTT